MTPNPETKIRIRQLVIQFRRNPEGFGVLSTGEQLAIALVLNDADLLRRSGWSKWLQAADRLGPEWLTAAVSVQHDL